MAKCTPSISLEGPQRFHLGDPVRGVVRVDVDEDVRANKVDVELVWRTHGRGDVDKGVIATHTVPGAEWKAGRGVQLPFEFELPRDGPITTRGTLVNLDWYVTARVDLPWAIDPKAEVDLIVEAEGAPPIFTAPNAFSPVVHAGKLPATAQLGCALAVTAFVAPFYLGAAGFLIPVVAAFTVGNSGVAALPTLIAPLLFALIPTVILYKVWHAYLGHRFLAGAKVVLDPSIADAGEAVRVRFDVPKNPQAIETVSATMFGRERARYRSGTDTRIATHELHRADVTMQRQGSAWVGRAMVPTNAITSLATPNNFIEWHVELKATVKGAPDPTFTEPLLVRGRGARGAG